MVSSTTLGLLDLSGVSVRTFSRMLPSASTTPAITFVPPMSMPTVGHAGRREVGAAFTRADGAQRGGSAGADGGAALSGGAGQCPGECEVAVGAHRE